MVRDGCLPPIIACLSSAEQKVCFLPVQIYPNPPYQSTRKAAAAPVLSSSSRTDDLGILVPQVQEQAAIVVRNLALEAENEEPMVCCYPRLLPRCAVLRWRMLLSLRAVLRRRMLLSLRAVLRSHVRLQVDNGVLPPLIALLRSPYEKLQVT
eukprot:911724-Rhodomonas_salina.1